MARAKEKIRHSVFRTVLWIRLGNVIVPVGIRHSVVQIAVESTVMHPVVRVTVKKELRPISPYLKGCDTLSGFSVLHAVWRVILSSIIQFLPLLIPLGDKKGQRHRTRRQQTQCRAERSRKHRKAPRCSSYRQKGHTCHRCC